MLLPNTLGPPQAAVKASFIRIIPSRFRVCQISYAEAPSIPYQRIHLHPERLLDPQRHIP